MHPIFSILAHHSSTRRHLLLSCWFTLMPMILFSQATFHFNALGDIEFSQAGANSHFYYNEIDAAHTDARLSIAQLNVMGKLDLGKHWSLTTRLLLEREKGGRLEKFQIPQLNLQWLSTNRKYGLTIGRFVNPFGSFNEKQLSTDRSFIGLPLAYAYYVNISENIGFLPNMGDVEKIAIDGTVQWGSTNLYYGGYTTGLQFSWNIKPAKIHWKTAVVNGASNLQHQLTKPLRFGLISHLKIQPTYFWEQGFSFSRGSFLQESMVSHQLPNLNAYAQTIIGTDFKFGSGFFELSGEVIKSYYKVPVFDIASNTFETTNESGAQLLNNLAVYVDLKYEPPVLQGSYVAYRIDQLSFSESEGYQNQPWDNQVLRHSFAVGYNITSFLLVRGAVSTQHTDNKQWDKTQRTFRLVMTAHY